MGQGQDRTRDPWICSQTCYRRGPSEIYVVIYTLKWGWGLYIYYSPPRKINWSTQIFGLCIHYAHIITSMAYAYRVPRPDFGTNIGPFPIQKLAQSSQNCVYHSQFLSSTFWWKFHENLNTNSKVTDAWKYAKKCEWKHETFFQSYFCASFHEVLWWAYSTAYTASSFYGFESI